MAQISFDGGEGKRLRVDGLGTLKYFFHFFIRGGGGGEGNKAVWTKTMPEFNLLPDTTCHPSRKIGRRVSECNVKQADSYQTQTRHQRKVRGPITTYKHGQLSEIRHYFFDHQQVTKTTAIAT